MEGFRWPGQDLDPNDVCQFGHQLAPGSEPIKITTTDPETGKIIKEETFLLRNHLVRGEIPRSEFRPSNDDV
jgi:hypothetical protein